MRRKLVKRYCERLDLKVKYFFII